jgi:DNA-binding MarR family transcriptional regulator
MSTSSSGDPATLQYIWQTWIRPSRHFGYTFHRVNSTDEFMPSNNVPEHGPTQALPLLLKTFSFQTMFIHVNDIERRIIHYGSDKYLYQLHPSSHAIMEALIRQGVEDHSFAPESVSSCGWIQSDLAKTLNLDARSMFNYVKRLVALDLIVKEKTEGEPSGILQLHSRVPLHRVQLNDPTILTNQRAKKEERVTPSALDEVKEGEDGRELDLDLELEREPSTRLSSFRARHFVPFALQVEQYLQAAGTSGLTASDILSDGFPILADVAPRRVRSTPLDLIINQLLKERKITKKLEHFGRKRQFRYFSVSRSRLDQIEHKRTPLRVNSQDKEQREAILLDVLRTEKCLELNKAFVSRMDQVPS